MNLAPGVQLTHFVIGGQRVFYRHVRVKRSGGNGLVLQDAKTDEFLEVAYDPLQPGQDFRIRIEPRLGEAPTRERARELWTLNAYSRVIQKVKSLVTDLSSITGLETTYEDLLFSEPRHFRDYWLEQLSSVVKEPQIIDDTGKPITDDLRPLSARKL